MHIWLLILFDKGIGIAALGSGSTNLADAELLNSYATWLEQHALVLASQKGLTGDETLELEAEYVDGSGEMTVRCAEGCEPMYVGLALLQSGVTILQGSKMFEDRLVAIQEGSMLVVFKKPK